MEQSSSFLEEGRAWRDEKHELVSRKEMDNVPESHFIRCPESGVTDLGPPLGFWRLMNSDVCYKNNR